MNNNNNFNIFFILIIFLLIITIFIFVFNIRLEDQEVTISESITIRSGYYNLHNIKSIDNLDCTGDVYVGTWIDITNSCFGELCNYKYLIIRNTNNNEFFPQKEFCKITYKVDSIRLKWL